MLDDVDKGVLRVWSVVMASRGCEIGNFIISSTSRIRLRECQGHHVKPQVSTSNPQRLAGW